MAPVPLEVFANNPSTTVSSGGTGAPGSGTSETWTVASSASFPAAAAGAQQFHVADPAQLSEMITVQNVAGTTWTVVRGAESSTPVAHAAGFTVVQVVTAGVLASLQYQPWQFAPEAYGALGDGRLISDASITNGSNVLTSAGIPAAAAPTLAHTGTGTVLAGTYQVEVTYVNPFGESLPSASASVTTTGSTSVITITAPFQTADATGWYAYVTQAGGSSYTRQQAPGSPTPIGTNLTLTAPPTNTGAAPPGANTTASNPFTAADIGKHVWIPTLWGVGTITGFTDSAHVTLSFTSAGTSAPTGVAYGTDDTAAVQSAINAATAYSLQGAGRPGEVVFGAKIYCIAGPAVIGGATGGNSQLTLPPVNEFAGPSAELQLTGAGWQGMGWVTEEIPVQAGTILLSMRIDATVDGTYGYPFVIGGNYSSASSSNMGVTVENIAVVVPAYGSATATPYGGLGLNGVLVAKIKSFSYLPLAIEAHGYSNPSQTWPNIDGGLASVIPPATIGLMMPAFNNQAVNEIGIYHCELATWALVGTEHVSITNFFCQYCSFGWAPSGGHGQSCLAWSCQRTPYPLDTSSFSPGGRAVVHVDMLSMETWTAIANDPGANLNGTVHWQSGDTAGTYFGNQIASGANIPGLKLIYDGTKPGAVSPPSVPATTVACPNYFYRDATVYITSGGAAVTVIAVDATTTGLTLGTSGTVTARVPSGHSITLTYASTAPTWTWVLE